MRTRSFASGLAALALLSAALSCQNINVDTAIVDPCTFDHGTGKYAAPFDLMIENDDPAVEIWYTDDGVTVPTQGGAGCTQYTVPINIDRTTIIRAKGFKTGLRASDERSATFTFVWTRGADMPGAGDFWGRSLFGCAELGGLIYCVGGLQKTGATIATVDTVLKYNPVGDSWSTAPPISAPRQCAETVSFGDKLYVIGGADFEGTAVNIVQEFDPDGDDGAGVWTVKTAMPTPRYGHKVSVLGTKIFVFGGRSGSTNLDVVEAYEPSTDSWTEDYEPMPIAGRDFGLGVVSGKAYLFGGNPSGISDKVQVYDSVSDNWSTATDLPFGLNYLQAASFGGKIYIIGGNNSLGTTVATVEEFDPSGNGNAGSWTTKTAMPHARCAFGVAVDSTYIYCLSGLKSTGEYNSFHDIYEPGADN